MCGASRTVATEFSFLLAIPTMLGAGLLRGVKFLAEGNRVTPSELVILAIGIVTAYLVSKVAVDFLTDFVSRRGFLAFGIYRIILGGALLLFFL
jgi:undecaprenyl-diphosphatase